MAKKQNSQINPTESFASPLDNGPYQPGLRHPGLHGSDASLGDRRALTSAR